MTFEKKRIPWNKEKRGDIIIKRRKDITGQKFNRLIALGFHSRRERSDRGFRYYWNFICDCGNKTIADKSAVIGGYTTSCGCRLQELKDTAGERMKTHGMSHTRFHVIYQRIRSRCEYTKNNRYHIYGARGIKCLWKTFEEFIEDMYGSYQIHVKEFGEKNTSIDRKDNNGNYSKENCRWATAKEQARNTSQNRIINFKGKKQCLSEWADEVGIQEFTIRSRIDILGWSISKTLTTKVRA